MTTLHELNDIFGYMPFDHFLVVRRIKPRYYPKRAVRYIQLSLTLSKGQMGPRIISQPKGARENPCENMD
jgi:hypothetical protein